MAEIGMVCGIVGWTGPKPGDPSNNSTLSANAGYGGVAVSWTYPSSNAHAVAHVLLFKSSSSDFSSATQLMVLDGTYLYDRIPSSEIREYFYWIKFVSVNGTVGELIGPASATPIPLIDEIIADLSGKIDAGVLATALRADIESIRSNGLMLIKEIADRLANNVLLGEALAAVQSSTGEALTYIREETTERRTADSAMVSSINVLAAGLQGNTAALVEEQIVRVTRDAAIAQSVLTLDTKLGTSTASLISDQKAQATAHTALASSVTLMGVTVAGNTSAISNEATVRATKDTTFAANVVTLTAQFNKNAADIVDESTTRATADSATATRITTVQSTMGTQIAAVQTSMETNLTTLTGKVSDAVTDVNTLGGSVATANGKLTAIGALYTAKVSVNGLVGGFGVYNSGMAGGVEAGFDVDTFWIGKTAANKVKPFIISGGVTYISSAVIANASVGTLKIAGNAVTVPQVDTKYDHSLYSSTHTIYVSMSEAGKLFASVTIAQGYLGEALPGWSLTLSIGGVQVYSSGLVLAAFQQSATASGGLAVGAGTHAVTMRWTGDKSYVTLNQSSMYAVGAKR